MDTRLDSRRRTQSNVRQQFDELTPGGRRERGHGRQIRGINERIERRQQLLARIGDPTHHLPTVGSAPGTPNKRRRFQFVQESRDGRAFLDHAITNGQRRQPIVAGAAQDSQHVVLREADAVRFDHARKPSTDYRRRSQEGNGRLL